MSRLKPLTSGLRGWLALAPTPSGWTMARAREENGSWPVESEQDVADLAAVADGGAWPVVTAVGSPDVVCQTLVLPATDPAELRQMLELQLDQLSPLPAEEVVTDFIPLETRDSQTRVLVVIGRKQAINDRVAPLEAAGLPPQRVTVDVLALFRALRARGVLAGDDRLHGFVRVQQDRADFILFTRGQPVVVRTVLQAGRGGGLAEELQRTTLAAQAELPGVEPGVLTVSGPVGDLGRGWDGAVREWPPQETPSLAASLCAEAAATPSLNLLPQEWRQRRQAARRRRLWLRTGLAAAAVYLLSLIVLLGATGWRRAQVNALRAEKQKLEPAYRAARQLNSELLAIQAQLDDKYSALEILREVSLALPPNVQLNSFHFRRDDALTLKGQTDSAQAVYSLVERLQQGGLFREVKTAGGGVRSDPGSGLTRFEVTASLASAVGRPGGAGWR